MGGGIVLWLEVDFVGDYFLLFSRDLGSKKESLGSCLGFSGRPLACHTE